MSALDFRMSSAQLADHAYVVAIGGEVDLHTAPRLDEELNDLTAIGATRIVVDLAGATFIDSTVLGVLLKTLNRLEAGGGELVLVTDDRRVTKVFEITGLNRVFRIEPMLTSAVAAVVGAV